MKSWHKFLLWGIGSCLLVFVYARYNPEVSSWMPKCPFKLLTGWQCPGCGAQRFFHSLLQGQFAQAVRYNYFLLLGLPYLMLFFVRDAMPQGVWRTRLTSVIEHRIVVTFYIVLYFVWLVVRNVWGL